MEVKKRPIVRHLIPYALTFLCGKWCVGLQKLFTMEEQTKDFLIGILIIGLIAVGAYYLLTKCVYNPYGYKQVKPTGTHSLDTTKWRSPQKDTIPRRAI